MIFFKIAAAAIAAILWSLGLADQFGDPMQAAKYVGISVLMVAVTFV